MLTIPQDMTLRRLQQTGLLLNFMTEEQKLAVYNKYIEDAKSGNTEKAINAQISTLNNVLKTLDEIRKPIMEDLSAGKR